jgi:hypothetical protein
MNTLPVAVEAALSRLPNPPAYIKEAGWIDRNERAKLPGAAFADAKREYPAFSKASVYLSAVAYYAGAERNKATEDGLRKAANLFDIEADVDAIPQHIGPKIEKCASTEADFALVFDHEGERIRLFPLSTESELLKSASSLESTRDRTTCGMRRTAARALLKRANELNVTLPGYVHKAAGVGPVTLGDVRRGLAHRVAVTRGTNRELYQKLAAVLPTGDDAVAPNLDTVADALDTADRLSKLHTKHASGLETPEEICYRGETPDPVTLKAGRSRVAVALVKAAGLVLDDLLPLGDRFVEAVRAPFQLFDKSAGINWSSLVVASENLGDSDSRLLARIVRGRGVAVTS